MNVIDGDMHLLGIRPEHVRIDSRAPLRGAVQAVQLTGGDRYVYVNTPRGEIVARLPVVEHQPAVGEEVGLAFDDARLRRYDRSTGRLLS